MKLKIHHAKTTKEAIKNFKEFLEVDMWSKIYPIVRLRNENWCREDYFESEKDFQEYLDIHFGIFEREIRRCKKKK